MSEKKTQWKGKLSASPYNDRVLPLLSHKVEILDTTLRDGEQAPGIALSMSDKIAIAKALDDLGVDEIEAGFSASGKDEKETLKRIARLGLNARVCSLARSTVSDIDAVIDTGLDYIHTFIATSDIHLERKLKMTKDQVLDRAVSAVQYAKDHGLKVQFSCEDATRSDLDFLKKVYGSVAEAGADLIDIPDTVGVMSPRSMEFLVSEISKSVKVPIAVHCHNDMGLATANSIAAVEAGASQVHVCVNGLGERAGNAPLEEVAVLLFINYGITTVELSKIGQVSKAISRYTGYPIEYTKPIIGRNAFAHESGIHVHGMLADSSTYEAFPPELVGMDRNISLGKHSGAHSVRERLDRMKVDFPEDRMPELMESMKAIAVGGKKIDDIELAVIADNVLWKDNVQHSVALKEFVVITGKNVTPTATVTIEMDGKKNTVSQVGLGPVDAAMKAIRDAVNGNVSLEELRLDAITGGSDSICEVSVVVKDAKGDGSASAGKAVGLDIVNTSVDAIMEAINRDYSRRKSQ
jgi:2-isopropylmalate synthase